MNSIIYYGLCFAQFCTFCAYVVVTAGAALLQQRANNLPLWDGLTGTDLANTQAAYMSVFTESTYIIGYPTQPWFQFQYQWWIIEFEFFVFVLTLACTLFPNAVLPRLRPVALTFIASALVLVMDNINAIFFLLRNDTAKMVFEEYRIQTAQAGLIMVGCANFMTIFFLGMYDATPKPAESYTTEGKRVDGSAVNISANAV